MAGKKAESKKTEENISVPITSPDKGISQGARTPNINIGCKGLGEELLKTAAVKKEKLNPETLESFQDVAQYSTTSYGLPLQNNIPLCRLFGTTILPFSRAYTLVGQEGSLKSSIGWYLIRQTLWCGGIAIYIDTEHKSDSVISMATLDMPEIEEGTFDNRIATWAPSSVEESLGLLKTLMEKYLKITGGQYVPMLILFDSLNGAPSKSTIDTINGQTDPAGYSGMHEARQKKDHLQVVISQYLSKYPILLLATNQEKKEKASNGAISYSEPGGYFKEFAWSGKIRTHKLKVVQTAAGNETIIKMRSDKTSIGEQQHSWIPVRFTARQDEVGKLHARFNWDAALTAMLIDRDLIPANRFDSKLSVMKEQGSETYKCAKLGLSGLSAEEMGQTFHRNRKLREFILYDVLRMSKHPVIDNGVIYSEAPCIDNNVTEGTSHGLPVKFQQRAPILDDPSFYKMNEWPKSVIEGSHVSDLDLEAVKSELAGDK